MMRKAIFCALIIAILFTASAACADGEWYCPKCGRLNTENFCPQDGTERPSDLPDAGLLSGNGAEIPFLSDTCTGSAAHLRLLNDSEARVQSRSGPANSYAGCGGYKPAKQVFINAFFIEDGWVLSHIKYRSLAEERYVYFPLEAFDQIGDLPVYDELPYTEGIIIDQTDPNWGPGDDFNTVPEMRAAADTPIRVFFQENGYVYGEYAYQNETARMWFPAEKVSLPEPEIPVPEVPATDEPVMEEPEAVIPEPEEPQPETETEKDEELEQLQEDARESAAQEVPYVCPVCGTQAEKDNIRFEDQAYYIWSEDYHKFFERMYVECANCGIRFYPDPGIERIEPHEYNDEGICIYCGYRFSLK